MRSRRCSSRSRRLVYRTFTRARSCECGPSWIRTTGGRSIWPVQSGAGRPVRAITKSPALLKEIVTSWQDGRIKLFLTDKALNFRRENRDLFLQGAYIPVPAAGIEARTCARSRGDGRTNGLSPPRLSGPHG